MNAQEQLSYLKKLPCYEQGSKEWLDQRKGKLTSSDVATALGINPYKKAVELLLEKCGAERKFFGNVNTQHGHKYEEEAIKNYEIMMGRENHVFGMISFSDLDPIRKKNGSEKYIDSKYSFLGGSPDGISIDCPDRTILSQVEVKCPLKRRIQHGKIPSYYYPQVQLNMFIMELDVTDFIEYIPEGIGKNVEFNIVRIYRNEKWFDENFPVLQKFWEDVLLWRTRDIRMHPEYSKYYPDMSIPRNINNRPLYKFLEDSEEEKPVTFGSLLLDSTDCS